MTPAQVAHIMPPLPEWSKCDDLGGLVPSEIRQELTAYASAAVEAALRDAPQAEGWMMVPKVPTPEMKRIGGIACTLGQDIAHHCYTAMLAVTPSAPTAVEP